MDKLADKLFDSGLNVYADELDQDELGDVEDYPRDEVQDDQVDEDELADVLGLSGGAAMKAMKAMKVMKAMKAMKKLKAFTQKRYAFAGKLTKTASGLTKSDLVKNKRGKIVSKKNQAFGQKSAWIKAVM